MDAQWLANPSLRRLLVSGLAGSATKQSVVALYVRRCQIVSIGMVDKRSARLRQVRRAAMTQLIYVQKSASILRREGS